MIVADYVMTNAYPAKSSQNPFLSSQEKRRGPRMSVHTEVWIGQDGIFTQNSQFIEDLSESGAFIETSQQFSIGSVIAVRFRLPGVPAYIDCSANVRNTRGGCGLGVEFLDMSPESSTNLRTFLGA